MAGVPELGGGAKHVGLGVLQHVLHQRIGLELGAARIVFLQAQQLDGALLALLERLHFRAAALDAALFQDGGLLLFQRIELIEQPRRGKAQRRRRFARGPHVDQAMQRIFALLDALLVAHRAGLGALGAAEALALVADHRLDGREQLGCRHQSHRHARAPEDRFDDFAVVEVGHDHAVLHRVSAHDAAGRDLQIEDGIAGRGELVDEFLGRGAAIEGACVASLPESPRNCP